MNLLDDISTPEKETLSQDVTLAFKRAAALVDYWIRKKNLSGER